MKPRLLDTYCGGGGCTKGYQRAGFYVVGVDINPQKNYCGDEFYQGDAIEFIRQHGHEYDAIHASPPCHFYSTGTQHRKNQGIIYPDLIDPTRNVLLALGKPYVIENVPGARVNLRQPVLLCGGMFGLGVMRHRLFETNCNLITPEHTCNGKDIDRDALSVTRHGPPARWYREHPGATFDITMWHDAMGIDWMTRAPLTQAIPPAYTEYIGRQLLDALDGVAWSLPAVGHSVYLPEVGN